MADIASRPALGHGCRGATIAVALLIIALLVAAAVFVGVGRPRLRRPFGPSPNGAIPYPSDGRTHECAGHRLVAPLRESPIAQGSLSSIQFGALDGSSMPPDFAIGSSQPASPSDVGGSVTGVDRTDRNDPAGGCSIGDVGHYRWSVSEDGAWLTVEPIDDACENRSGIVVRGPVVRGGS